MKHWIEQNLIAIDQLINTLFFFGWADETLSARIHRSNMFTRWRMLEYIVDTIFFWKKDYCEDSWAKGMMRRQAPVEFREKRKS